jgi:hypothetical protein
MNLTIIELTMLCELLLGLLLLRRREVPLYAEHAAAVDGISDDEPHYY